MKNKNMAQSRFNISHNSTSNILTAIFTNDLSDKIEGYFKFLCPVEFMSATKTTEDSWNEDGDLFKDCVVIKFRVQADVIDRFFDAAKTVLRESISKSINHVDN